MRCAKFGFALLGILACLCLLGLRRLEHIVTDTQSLIDSAQELAAQSRCADALDAAQQARQLWQTHRLFLGAVLRHEDADELFFLFARLPYLASGDEAAELRAACGELNERLRHILDAEQPRLYNIL